MKEALAVYSGGRPFDFGARFRSLGFGLRAVASHSIQFPAHPGAPEEPARVILTSRNAVKAAFDSGSLFRYGMPIHAVGPSTAEVLARLGVASEAAAGSSGELLETLPGDLSGETVYWPRGDDADLTLARELELRGARVFAPIVYRKVEEAYPTDLDGAIVGGRFRALACTSPAAAQWLFARASAPARRTLAGVPAACLGRATESALREAGVPSPSLSAEPTFESLATRLLQLLAEA